MRISKFVIILLVIILLTAAATQLAYYKYKYKSSKYIPMYVQVSDRTHIGLDTRTDALHFGIIPAGDIGTRKMNLTNNFDIPVEVQITSKGDISQWVVPELNLFVINPGETRHLSININIPPDAAPGNYTGGMYIFMKRA